MKHKLVLAHLTALLSVIVALVVVMPAQASPTTFNVDSTLDEPAAVPGVCLSTPSSKCTLRAAIQAANAIPGADTILLPSGVYTLTIPPTGPDDATTGDLNITDDLTMTGDGSDVTIIDGGGLDRVIDVSGVIKVSLSGVTIRNGGNVNYGGGIRNSNSSTLTVTSSQVITNFATIEGGGIRNTGILAVISSSIAGNDVGSLGGGIRNVTGGSLEVLDTSFTANTAGASGGGIHNTGSLAVSNGVFATNSAIGGGGGLLNLGSSAVTHVSFITNSASQGGGGVQNLAALTVTDSLFAGNITTGTTQSYGGAIRNTNNGFYSGTMTVRNSTFTNNTARLGGGGIFNTGELTITTGAFYSNTTPGSGAAINNATITASLSIANGVFDKNIAAGNAGGIQNNGTLIINATALTNNKGISGGAINNYAVVTLTNSNLLSNTATTGNGGGINNGGRVLVDRSTLSNDVAGNVGGGIFNMGGLTITNSTFTANFAANPSFNGGAIYNTVLTSSLTIINSTFVSNTVPTNGGSIHKSSGAATLKNTIVAFGSPNNCSGTFTSQGHNLDSDNTCSFSATGDITNTNPLVGPLQNNGGSTLTHALLTGSPAINAGDNNGCPPTDQRGVPRIGVCDIGAYEYALSLFLPMILR